jgi:chromosome segregation ATPase
MVHDRAQDETELRRQVKNGEAKLEQLVEARYKREAAESILAEHRQDMAVLQAEVNRLEATITRQKKQQELDRLIDRQKNLQADWTSKAASITGSLITSLEALHALECKAGPLRRELEVAARELGVETPDRPNFPFRTAIMAEYPAYPEGYYGVTFDVGAYRVTIDPRRDSQQDRA